MRIGKAVRENWFRLRWSKTMAREELKWQNIDADDLPTDVKKSFNAMIEAEAAFKGTWKSC
jgi:hypothetical protein